MKHALSILVVFLVFISCKNKVRDTPEAPQYQPGSFGYDLQFLQERHEDLIILGEDTAGPRVIVLPAYQGRVMTSTSDGNMGRSIGWVNHELIASGKLQEHMNAFGGEERIWLGPEGGQFSFFFKRNAPFTFENWQVPKEFDTEPFDLKELNTDEVVLQKEMNLTNYSGAEFKLRLSRTVRLLSRGRMEEVLGVPLPEGVKTVGFETDNSIMNLGGYSWTRKTGMPSIWILSMLNASPGNMVLVPFKPGDSASLGKIVTDDYFGKVPPDRLKIQDSVIFFKADAAYRSKIGLSPRRAKPFIASYDPANQLLTIARFSLPRGTTDFVNSEWKLQTDPFSGDAVNAYNDGPVDGKQMGGFYEIESSSPAAALGPGMTLGHKHATIHIKGDPMILDQVARKVLGISLTDTFRK